MAYRIALREIIRCCAFFTAICGLFAAAGSRSIVTRCGIRSFGSGASDERARGMPDPAGCPVSKITFFGTVCAAQRADMNGIRMP